MTFNTIIILILAYITVLTAGSAFDGGKKKSNIKDVSANIVWTLGNQTYANNKNNCKEVIKDEKILIDMRDTVQVANFKMIFDGGKEKNRTSYKIPPINVNVKKDYEMNFCYSFSGKDSDTPSINFTCENNIISYLEIQFFDKISFCSLQAYACIDGHFGEDCKKKCHCPPQHDISPTPCDQRTGACKSGRCEAGWHGDGCQLECEGGRFGESCNQTCNCCLGSVCDRVTGHCDSQCNHGWFGPDCQTALPEIVDDLVLEDSSSNEIKISFKASSKPLNPQYFNLIYRALYNPPFRHHRGHGFYKRSLRNQVNRAQRLAEGNCQPKIPKKVLDELWRHETDVLHRPGEQQVQLILNHLTYNTKYKIVVYPVLVPKHPIHLSKLIGYDEDDEKEEEDEEEDENVDDFHNNNNDVGDGEENDDARVEENELEENDGRNDTTEGVNEDEGVKVNKRDVSGELEDIDAVKNNTLEDRDEEKVVTDENNDVVATVDENNDDKVIKSDMNTSEFGKVIAKNNKDVTKVDDLNKKNGKEGEKILENVDGVEKEENGKVDNNDVDYKNVTTSEEEEEEEDDDFPTEEEDDDDGYKDEHHKYEFRDGEIVGVATKEKSFETICGTPTRPIITDVSSFTHSNNTLVAYIKWKPLESYEVQCDSLKEYVLRVKINDKTYQPHSISPDVTEKNITVGYTGEETRVELILTAQNNRMMQSRASHRVLSLSSQQSLADNGSSIWTGWMDGGGFLLILLLVVVFILFLTLILAFFVYRRKQLKSLCGRAGVLSYPHAMQNGSILLEEDFDAYKSHELMRRPKVRVHRPPIKVVDLADYVKQRSANNFEELRKEYKEIPEGNIEATTKAGFKIDNRLKNRFINIIPYDHSRVKLQMVQGDASSDYINANYIDGYKMPKFYIAAQGCNKWSVQDIWRMLWQENSLRIVMLTNLCEKGRSKCEQYWPDVLNEEKSYGDIHVTLTNLQKFATHVIRSFTVRKCIDPSQMSNQVEAHSNHADSHSNTPLNLDTKSEEKHNNENGSLKNSVINKNDNDKKADNNIDNKNNSINNETENDGDHYKINTDNNSIKSNKSTKSNNNNKNDNNSLKKVENNNNNNNINNKEEEEEEEDEDDCAEKKALLSNKDDNNKGDSNGIKAERVGATPPKEAKGDVDASRKQEAIYANMPWQENIYANVVEGFVEESRQVVQLHFTSWPDHGVPNHTAPLIAFRNKVRKLDATHPGPIIVHCSAGVGRSGTFIALDYLLKQAEEEDQIALHSLTHDMRKNRCNMIQTVEQYIFVYEALIEALKSASTSVCASKFLSWYQEISTQQPSIFDTQFKQLEEDTELRMKSRHVAGSDEVKTALLPLNVSKNRNPDIIPEEDNRPFLMTQVEGTNSYINAVFLDTYRQHNSIILTQMPLLNTVIDLWKLIYDYKCCAIVMINSFDPDDESLAQYWPEENEECECGPFLIETMATDREDEDIVVRQLQLNYYSPESSKEKLQTSTNENKTSNSIESSSEVKEDNLPANQPTQIRHVTHLQLTSWPNQKSLPSSCLSLIRLVEKVHDLQKKFPEEPIVFHCVDGATQSGMVVSLLCAWEKMQDEAEVDVFDSVSKLKAVRPHIVPSLEQYTFLYESINFYLKEFSTYSN